MKELNRYPVPNSDIVLIHVLDDDGDECIWATMCPPETGFDPQSQSECFIVAGSEDGFVGLSHFNRALIECAVGLGKLPRPIGGEQPKELA